MLLPILSTINLENRLTTLAKHNHHLKQKPTNPTVTLSPRQTIPHEHLRTIFRSGFINTNTLPPILAEYPSRKSTSRARYEEGAREYAS